MIWTVLIAVIISGCSVSFQSTRELGFWKDVYPRNVSEWQCVEQEPPHHSKKCDGR